MKFLEKLKIILKDKAIRKRILFVLFVLVIFRLLAAIPIPGIDTVRLEQFLRNNQFLGILNIFSGGGLTNLSIMMLGVGPYITGSIIMQVLTIMVPRLKSLYQEEGEIGKKKFAQYSRILTIPLAIIQGLSLMVLLERQGVLEVLTLFQKITSISLIVGGSMLLMWLGELISEYGIGNGVSLLIFAGIVSVLPTQISQLLFTFDQSQIPLYLVFLVSSILIIVGVVYVTEAERPIPVTYAKQVRGGQSTGGSSTYIPLRVNQAGVIPIIFALSILLFPQILSNLFASSSHAILQKISTMLSAFIANVWLYSAVYFVLVFVFTFFYTAVTFDPEAMSKNLQKNGAFIPGIRPGESTSQFVTTILTRITFIGALFLGIIAVLPLIVQNVSGITAVALGGTSLLIVVSVVIDLIKKLDAQVSMREY